MLRVYGVEGCGPCEVTKLFLTSRHIPFEFIDVTNAPDRRRELGEKLGESTGSPTGGVILEDGARLEAMQGVSVAKLNRWLNEYQARRGV